MSMIKRAVKPWVRSVFLKESPVSVLVASMGRSGSTMIADAVSEATLAGRGRFPFSLPNSLVSEAAWTLKEGNFKPGMVYKTHDFPDGLEAPDFLKVIYLFGNPYDVIRSVLHCEQELGKSWIKEHFDHLKCDFAEYRRILDTDILDLDGQLDAWLRQQRFPLLTVKYEAIWDHEREISDFLGLDLRLPTKRERGNFSKIVPPEKRSTFSETYAAIANRIGEAPEFKIWQAEK